MQCHLIYFSICIACDIFRYCTATLVTVLEFILPTKSHSLMSAFGFSLLHSTLLPSVPLTFLQIQVSKVRVRLSTAVQSQSWPHEQIKARRKQCKGKKQNNKPP